MTESEKSTWPKLPSGTIDWETVFEDPVKGLVPLISQAQTATALRDMTVLVIKKLYARKDDPAEVERFVIQLSEMLPDDTPVQALPKVLNAVTGILRQVRDERIRIAAEYSEEKARKQEADDQEAEEKRSAERSERRKRHRTKELEREEKEKAKTIRLMLIGGFLIVSAIIGAAAFFFLKGQEPPSSQELSMQFIEQMKDAAVNEPPATHIHGGDLRIGQNAGRKFVSASAVPVYTCKSAAWVLLNRGTIVINDVLPSKVSPGILKELCSKSGTQAKMIWFPKKPEKTE